MGAHVLLNLLNELEKNVSEGSRRWSGIGSVLI